MIVHDFRGVRELPISRMANKTLLDTIHLTSILYNVNESPHFLTFHRLLHPPNNGP